MLPVIPLALGAGALYLLVFRKKPTAAEHLQAAQAAAQQAPSSGGGGGKAAPQASAKVTPAPGVPQVGTTPGQIVPAGTPDPTTATVSTHDPAPAGDLTVHSSPNGPTIGTADKGGTVQVLQWNADGNNAWAKISWVGGRKPAVTGYANRNYLAGNAPGTQVNQMVQTKAAEQNVADAGNAPASMSGEDDHPRILIVTLSKPTNRLKLRTGPASALPAIQGGNPKQGGGVPNGAHVVASGDVINGFVKVRFQQSPTSPQLIGYAHSKALST